MRGILTGEYPISGPILRGGTAIGGILLLLANEGQGDHRFAVHPMLASNAASIQAGGLWVAGIWGLVR